MDKKTQNLLLLSRVVGNGDKADEDGCWYVYNYMGTMSEPEWKSPCPYGTSSSFSNASGTGCWYNFIDPDTGQSILQYRDPCPVALPDRPMSKGGRGGRRTPRRRRRR